MSGIFAAENWPAAIVNFRYNDPSTPFSHLAWPLGACAVYFAVVHVLQAVMKGRKALEFRGVLIVHNLMLAAGSLAVWVPLMGVVMEKGVMWDFDPFKMICSEEMHEDGRLQFVYYVNYFFKYYELLDTVFLVLRKKPVIFLHEYHHAATLVLTWVQMREHATVQWVPIAANLFIHVLMYSYFAMTTLKINCWWKKYLTTMQIFQFVIDIIACSYAFYKHHVIPSGCNGTYLAAFVGIGILASYLALFIQFFLTMEAPKPRKKAAAKEAVVEATKKAQ